MLDYVLLYFQGIISVTHEMYVIIIPILEMRPVGPSSAQGHIATERWSPGGESLRFQSPALNQHTQCLSQPKDCMLEHAHLSVGSSSALSRRLD